MLTWEKFLTEEPFAGWDGFLPADFVTAARDRIRSAIAELQALGAKPSEAEVRAVLKECVEWFNRREQEDPEATIATIEREDICDVLADLAIVAGHLSLADEIDEWRNWGAIRLMKAGRALPTR